MEKDTVIFPIETITSQSGSEVSFCPTRGGIITGLTLSGTPILYFDNDTFIDPTLSVRGGIPILFPNAGALTSDRFPGLGQHGFARASSKWAVEKSDRGFTETIYADYDSQKMYPYDFKLSITGELHDDGSCTISQQIKNNEVTRALPVAMGLHPYFKVPHDQKENIMFTFNGGDYVARHRDVWEHGGTLSIDNPKIQNPDAVLEISIPTLGVLVLDVSVEYKKVWVWSQTGKDFICIEPVVRDVGGLISDPMLIGPEATVSAYMHISLKK